MGETLSTFKSRQDVNNFVHRRLNPEDSAFQNKEELSAFVRNRLQERIDAGPASAGTRPSTIMPSLQTPEVSESPGLLSQISGLFESERAPLSPGISTAPAVATGIQPQLTEESFKFSKLPQTGIAAREKPLRKRTTEEKKEFFVQRAADIVGGDINKLLLAQVPDPETTSQIETAAIALTHGLFPLIAAKSPIAQAEKAKLEEKFPITFMASELTGEALPIIGAFKATRFAIQPLAKAITKAVAKSSESKQVLTRFGLKATEGAIAGAVFDVLRGETPSPESAAMFAAFEVAVPGMQGLFRELKRTLVNPKIAEAAKKQAVDKLLQKLGRQELSEAAKTAKQIESGPLVDKEKQLIGDILTDRFRDPSLAPKQLKTGPILQPGKVAEASKPKISKRAQEIIDEIEIEVARKKARQLGPGAIPQKGKVKLAPKKPISKRAQQIIKEIEAEVSRKKAARTLPEPSFREAGPATIPIKAPQIKPKPVSKAEAPKLPKAGVVSRPQKIVPSKQIT